MEHFVKISVIWQDHQKDCPHYGIYNWNSKKCAWDQCERKCLGWKVKVVEASQPERIIPGEHFIEFIRDSEKVPIMKHGDVLCNGGEEFHGQGRKYNPCLAWPVKCLMLGWNTEKKQPWPQEDPDNIEPCEDEAYAPLIALQADHTQDMPKDEQFGMIWGCLRLCWLQEGPGEPAVGFVGSYCDAILTYRWPNYRE